jgi:hypothetical protein
MKVRTLFGHMAFIGYDAYIYEVQEDIEIEEDMVDEHMIKNHFDGYVIPSIFNGQIIYSNKTN